MTEPTTKKLYLDPATGEVRAIYETVSNIVRNSVFLGAAPAADRVVFLATGPVGGGMSLYLKSPKSSTGLNNINLLVNYVPKQSNGPQGSPPFTHVIHPGDTTWRIELPDELLTEASERLASLSEQPEQPA